MDFSVLLPYLPYALSALAALVAAFVGHKAGAASVRDDVNVLLADLHAGINLTNMAKDMSDLKKTMDDVHQVLKDAKVAAPQAGA